MTFADWVAAGAGDHGPAPTYDDLDYHLTTLFPVVRPHGYLEIRYLDQQAGEGWTAVLALVAALLSTPHLIDLAFEAAEPAVGRWVPAARDGLADPLVFRSAAALVDVGLHAMSAIDLSVEDLTRVTDRLTSLVDRAAATRPSADRVTAGRKS